MIFGDDVEEEEEEEDYHDDDVDDDDTFRKYGTPQNQSGTCSIFSVWISDIICFKVEGASSLYKAKRPKNQHHSLSKRRCSSQTQSSGTRQQQESLFSNTK